MKLKNLVTCSALLLSAAAFAETEDTAVNHDANEPAGFLTEIANQALEKAVGPQDAGQSIRYGRHETGWASAPKLGAYYIGGYKYSSQDGAHGGQGFTTRLIRAYVNGTILRHFDYRMQIELQNTVHMKDVYVEYTRFREARLKLGQFKRPFTFENPMNPWDVGVGDYSQLTKKLAGMNDYSYAEYNGSNGGRDLGLQLQGDLINVDWGGERHAFLHYQAAVMNGQGINSRDADAGKDLIGTVQLQPLKGLFVGVFGWRGSHTAEGVEAIRRRWAAGLKYDHKDWSLRAEYAHHKGSSIAYLKSLTEADPTYQISSADRKQGKAEALYVTLGAPVTPWLKIYAKWDGYTTDTWKKRQEIYSLAPNFQLNKNLMFQVQWNLVNNKAADATYHELWTMAYVRF